MKRKIKTSGYSRRVSGIFTLLGCYVEGICISLQTFRDKLWVPTSRVKQSKTA